MSGGIKDRVAPPGENVIDLFFFVSVQHQLVTHTKATVTIMGAGDVIKAILDGTFDLAGFTKDELTGHFRSMVRR
jgi:hypothetical protein